MYPSIRGAGRDGLLAPHRHTRGRHVSGAEQRLQAVGDGCDLVLRGEDRRDPESLAPDSRPAVRARPGLDSGRGSWSGQPPDWKRFCKATPFLTPVPRFRDCGLLRDRLGTTLIMARPTPSPGKRTTLRNIAQYARVSIGTVSSVLNHRHVERRISNAAVQRVRAAVAHLGYIPNISARRLRSRGGTGDSIVIAFITSHEAPLNVVDHFVSALRHPAGGGGALHSYPASILIEMFSAGHLSETPGLLTGDHFNAAIIANTVPEDDQFLQRAHLPYPVVLVNRTIPRYASVAEDPQTGTRAAGVLAQAGRRRLAVLHGRPLTQITQERVDSFIAATAALLGKPAQEVVADKISTATAYDAMIEFLGKGARIDGLYAVNDALALGAYRAIKEKGLAIPQDIAVVGVGDSEIAPFLDPPLSSVGAQRDQIGREAARLLLRQLHRPETARLQVKIPVVTSLRRSTE